MADITEIQKQKVIAKLLGIAYVKHLDRQKTLVTIPEFKYIISRYRICSKDWFELSKKLEYEGIVKIHRGHEIEIIIRPVVQRLLDS
jgi:hypothetical protein